MTPPILLLIFLAFLGSTSEVLAACGEKDLQVLILLKKSSILGNALLPNVQETLSKLSVRKMEFAVATYGSDSCYDLLLPFNPNPGAVTTLKIEGEETTPLTSALGGVFSAINDPKLTWSDDSRKVIILFVHDDSKGQPAPKCGTTQGLPDLSDLLLKKGIALGIVSSESSPQSLMSDWTMEFHEKRVQLATSVYNVSVVNTITSGIQSLAEDKPCFPESRTAPLSCPEYPVTLQVAFVIDRSSSFKNFFKHFSPLAAEIIKRLQAKYPGSEFALTSFTDYTEEQMYHLNNNDTDLTTGCYKVQQTFTTDPSKFAASVKAVKTGDGGDHPECSLTSILFTVADKTLGWKDSSLDLLVKKLVILVTDYKPHTDEDNHLFWKEEVAKRHPPRGDGTDTCLNTLFPNFKFVGEKLKEFKVRPIGFLTEDYNNKAYWESKFKSDFGIQKPKVYRFEFRDIQALVNDVEFAVKVTVCEDTKMADPPAYNTLGL